MKTIIKLVALLLLPVLLAAQGGIINNGSVVKVMSGTEVKVNNAGVVNKNAGVIANSGNIYLDQDWTQTGATTSYSGLGWMWFEGGANQNVSSTSPLVVPKLRVDNGQRLILGSDVVVTTAVDLMNNGNIELGSFNLVASPGATISNYDASNYIITNGMGVLQQEVGAANVVFPVGNSSYNPATLSNAGTTDNFQIRVFDQVFDQGTLGTVQTTNLVNRTWMLDEEIIGGSLVTLTTQWNTADELLLFDRNNSGIAHHLSGLLWDNPPAYTAATNVGPATWTQTRTGFTSFSPFVVNDANTDLPVDLINFDAKRLSMSVVNLEWATASETNNQGFDVERMLENETTFSKVAWVDGQGTTVNTSYYQIEDENGFAGVSYYRLKQIDFDGTISYSEIKAVRGWELVSATIEVFPNPVNDYINIRINSTAKEATIQIIDSKGALVLSKKMGISNHRMVQISNLSDLVSGVYLIRVDTDAEESYSQKFIKE